MSTRHILGWLSCSPSISGQSYTPREGKWGTQGDIYEDLEILIQSFMYFKSMHCIAYVWFCFVSEKTDVQSVGMIAGAVTGMVAGALLIFLLVWLLIRRKDKKRYEEEERPNEIR